jgi:hypothetical protein
MCKKLTNLLPFVLLTCLIMPAFGQVTLLNGSFEVQTLADGAWAEGVATNWTCVNSAGAQNLTSGGLDPPAHDGQNICFLNQNGQIYQGLQEQGNPVLVEANKIYKVSVWVGRRAGNEGTFGGILEAFLQDAQTLTVIDQVTYDLDNPDQPRNSWTFQTFYLSTGPNPPGLGSQLQVGFANISDRAPANQFWFGQVIIDDVGVEALNPIAINPSPADGSQINTTTVTLEWLPGPFATQHDIYFSDDLDDVDAATSSDPMGSDNVYKAQQSANSFKIDGLVPGTTYYWRIDEVGGATYKGDIWTIIVRPTTPYDPIPVNGAPFVDVSVELSWSAGTNAVSHVVYFGDNRQDVLAGTEDTNKGIVEGTTFTPETLEYEKIYYWRVDANDGTTIQIGDLWTFRTAPEIPISDPNLVAWWMLDDASGIGAFDSSGYGNHGTLYGGLTWGPGKLNGALSFNGEADSLVDCGNPDSLNITDAITLTAWVNTNDAGNSADSPYITKGNDSYALRHTTGNDIGFFIYDVQLYSAASSVSSSFNGVWHHLAGTYDGAEMVLYVDGESMATTEHAGSIAVSAFNVSMGSDTQQTWMWYNGSLDDVRIYNRALAADEIEHIIAGNTAIASEPGPEYASTIQMPDAVSLSWSPGDNAAEHDVYLGTDKKPVVNADTSTPEIYRGRQVGTSYTPPEGFDWGQTYFWRIDEINNDGTISTGSVWTFTVADYLIVEDFEDYNDYPPDEVWNVWLDGYFDPTNGSSAGYPDPDFVMGEHYLENETVHSGNWSFPLFYNNDVGISEVTRSINADWTVYGVNTLTLWYYGVVGNAAETMYVALNENSIAINEDADAALVNVWTRWDIPLQVFADQGVDLSDVESLSIGFGNKANPVAGGEGHVFFDDIRLYRP